jgi:tRNA(Ile)-lysidine synthase
VDEAVARSARHMAEAARLLEERARSDLARALDGDGLCVTALRAMPPERRRNALRTFIALSGGDLPPTRKLAEICGPLLAARVDAQPQVAWADRVMRRRGGRLKLEVVSQPHGDHEPANALKSWRWRHERECRINDREMLALCEHESGAIDLDRLPDTLELRERRGGESLRPGTRARTQPLKKLMQAARMTVEDRARLPLLFAGDRLLAAGDRWFDASIMANDKSRRRARLVWTRAR